MDNNVVAPPQFKRQSKEDARDVSVQDFITHGDFWIGVGCIVCACLAYFDHTAIKWISFLVGLSSVMWLMALLIIPGVLYQTNQGKGFNSIQGGAGATQQPIPTADQGNADPDNRFLGMSAVWAIAWFLFEAILVILGMYYTGWIQYALGAVALAILAAALMKSMGDKAVSNAVAARVQEIAIDRARNGQELADPMVAKQAAKKAAATAQKHRQLMIFTITDFTLASYQGFSCIVIHEAYSWVPAVTFSSFLFTGFWMFIVGKVTGNGDPGHAEEEIEDEEPKEERSLAELLAEARRENQA